MNRRGLAVMGAVVMLGCSGTKPPHGPAEAPRAVGTRPPELGPKVAGLERRAGLFDLYVDRAQGKVFAVLPAANGPRGRIAEVLYVEGITTGLGSNPVGLDRGQLGDTQVLDVRRVGSRILFEAENLRYRAQTDDPAERATVRESFATSVIWSGEVLAEDLVGRTLVDLTSFLVRDAHGVGVRLAQTGQGSFSLDRDRSAIDLDACLAFPKNLEFEAVLTFAGSQPGPEVRATAPDPQAVTLVQHQSLLRAPAGRLQAARLRPADGFVRGRVRRLLGAARQAHRPIAGSSVTAWRRPTPRRRTRRSGSRSSTTSIAARRSRSAPRWSKGPRGGRRRSPPPASTTPTASSCCRKERIRSTRATTSCSGCTARPAAGPTAAA